MKIGQRVRMVSPGATTSVPAGTEGVVRDLNAEFGYELEWVNGVSTTFPGDYDEVETVVPPGTLGVCDFCSLPLGESGWEHRCHDAPLGAAVVASKLVLESSKGSWLACDACHRLIEAEDRAATWPRSSLNVVLGQIRGVQGAFWRLRVGPGFRVRQEGS